MNIKQKNSEETIRNIYDSSLLFDDKLNLKNAEP